jgi:ABC-type glycerol-3-phosphate transport system permease component
VTNSLIVPRSSAITRSGAKPRRLMALVRGAVWLVLASAAGAGLYPVVFLALTALKTPSEYATNPSGLPRHLNVSNFQQAWSQADIGRYLLNSVEVVIPAAAVGLALATLGGFAFGCLRFPFRRTALIAVIGLMMLPPAVSIIPTLDVVDRLGLSDTHVALSLVYVSLVLPFNVFLLTSYFRTLPRELLAAARVDGAGFGKALIYVAVPYARSPMLTVFTLNFVYMWNELLYALLIIQTASRNTVMVGVASLQSEYFVSIPVLAAASLVAALPIMAVFAAFHRNIARGLTAGAIK